MRPVCCRASALGDRCTTLARIGYVVASRHRGDFVVEVCYDLAGPAVQPGRRGGYLLHLSYACQVLPNPQSL